MKSCLVMMAVAASAIAFAGVSPYANESVTGAVFGKPSILSAEPSNGMGLAMEGTKLYSGAGDVLAVWETADDPLHPRLLGKVQAPNRAEVRQIAVQDGIVYMTARECQVMIFDFRNPSAPKFLARYDCCELATGVDVAGDVLFVGQRQNGVEFIDVSNPADPRHIAMRKTDESQSVVYRDGFCYSGDWGTGYVTVFDCRDMANIRQTDKCELHGVGDGLWLKDKFLYCATGHHSKHRPTENLRTCMTSELIAYGHKDLAGAGAGHGMDVFEITDPAHPRHLGRVDFPPLYSRGSDWWTVRASGKGGIVFCAQAFNGLFAVDVSNPAQLRTLDRINFPPPMKDKDYPSAALGSVAVGDGVVYVAGRGVGVVAVPAKGAVRQVFNRGVKPMNASYREAYPNDDSRFACWLPGERGQVRGVAVKGDVAFAACGDAGLWRVKIAGDRLETLGKVPGIKQAYDVGARGDRLVVAEGLAGWGFYSIGGNGVIEECARIRELRKGLDFGFWCWFVSDNRAILSARNGGGYSVVALEDFAHPRLASWLAMSAPGWNKYMAGDLVDGRWIAWNMGNTAFAWGNLADVDKAVTVKSIPKYRGNLSCSPCVVGGKAMMPLGNGYRLLPPGETVQEAKKVPGRASFKGLAATDGRYVLLSDRIHREVSFYDFTDPENPKFLWEAKVSGNPDVGQVVNGVAFIPCGYQGLIMAKK